LTEQYFSIIIGGHFAMRRPLAAICFGRERQKTLRGRG